MDAAIPPATPPAPVVAACPPDIGFACSAIATASDCFLLRCFWTELGPEAAKTEAAKTEKLSSKCRCC
jgi:hypothetical protein